LADGEQPEVHYGQRLLDSINSISSDRIGVLLRHSVRDHIPRDQVGGDDDVRLTPLGHTEARRFGRKLRSGFNLIVSYSPVPRCVETAKEILAGYSDSGSTNVMDAGTEDFLAVLRYFTKDQEAMNSYKKTIGGRRFLREWLDNTLPSDMMESSQAVKQLFIQNITRELKRGQAPLLRIWVGHDYGFIVVRELILGGRFEEDSWMPYLDGLVLAVGSGDATGSVASSDPVSIDSRFV